MSTPVMSSMEPRASASTAAAAMLCVPGGPQRHTPAKDSYSDSYLDSPGYLRIALSSNSTQIARAI
eukprot:2056373-Prymnesium_polylepis.1